MTLLIKGMDAPASCTECLQVGWEYVFECCLDDVEEGERLATCPLTAVPTPHGRLIDADIILKAAKERGYISVSIPCIEAMPTIIKEEE